LPLGLNKMYTDKGGHVDGIAEGLDGVEPLSIAAEVGVLADPLTVTPKRRVVAHIKSDERREREHVALCQPVA
jgi:hypothetical protein